MVSLFTSIVGSFLFSYYLEYGLGFVKSLADIVERKKSGEKLKFADWFFIFLFLILLILDGSFKYY